MNDDYGLLSIATLADSIQQGELSPVELTSVMLDRIKQLNPKLHAYNTVTGEQALAQAKAAEAEIKSGRYRGPLHGIPLGLKDLLYTKDVKTTASSKILKDWVPDTNATVVDKLIAAGAICLLSVATAPASTSVSLTRSTSKQN